MPKEATTAGAKASTNGLFEEVQRLVAAIKDGQLSERARVDEFKGDDQVMLGAINELIDTFMAPFNVTAEYIDRISKGDIPEKITDEYRGDFNEVKNNLNQCIDTVNALVADADMLRQGAAEGNLDARADVSKHQGDYAAIVQGMNDTLEGIVTPLRDIGGVLDRLAAGDSKAQVTADYKGDYDVLKVAANNLGQQINAVVQEMGKMADAAAEGDLDYRGDAGRVRGDIAEIINGANRTIEFVAEPLREAGVALAAAAQKDVTKRVEGSYKGEFGALKDNINSALDAVDAALEQVNIAVVQVAEASGQISDGSQSLAEGAAEQASSLEEVSSSIEQMASMTKQNAANADEAKSLAGAAQAGADKGTAAMERMSKAINDIQKSADETSKIVKTIDEIAFQTNLLALNAAVEAARAGDAGRGFAVVAEEVRNLAQRSAEAAKNTANMIEESVKNAEGGVQISQEVAAALGEIAEGSRKVNDLVGEIAAASNEQAQGIDQINTAVAQMDKVTQQNAANSEESASAAEELSSQAEELRSMVATFNITGGTASSSRKSAPAVHGQTTRKPAAKPLATVKKGEGDGKKAQAAVRETAEQAIPLDEDDAELQRF